MHADTVFHIAFVGTRDVADNGDTETFVDEVGSRLAGAGHHATVFYQSPRWSVRAEFVRKNIRYVSMRRARFMPPGTDVISLAPVLHGFDLVYLCGGAAAFTLVPRLFRSETWLDVASLRHGRSHALVERMALSRATRIVTDTHATLHALESRHRSLAPALVIPRGADVVSHVDPEPLVDWELAPGCYYLMRSLAPEHRVREIVEGFLQAKSTFPLVVVGDIDNASRYAAHLRALAGARVRFIGKLNDRQRLRILHAHARGYFHGDASGSNNALLLEALGCGNIIIAHDNPINREIVGGLGQYFSAAEHIPEAVAWADNLEGARRRAYMKAAHELIATHHSWEHVTARFMEALETLTHARRMQKLQ